MAERLQFGVFSVGDVTTAPTTGRTPTEAERIKELTDSQSENVFVPYDQVYGQGIEDTLHREPAIEKIGNAIGWAPTRNLEDILRDVIEHSRQAPVPPEAELVKPS